MESNSFEPQEPATIPNRKGAIEKNTLKTENGLSSSVDTSNDHINPTIRKLAQVKKSSSAIAVWPPRPTLNTPTSADFSLDFPSDVAAETDQPTSSQPEKVLCIHCQIPLIDPNGLGICPDCGYCHSLRSRPENRPLIALPPALTIFFSESLQGWNRIPTWIWYLFAGSIGIISLSFFVHSHLPDSQKERIIWTFGQMVLGTLAVMIGQCWAIVKMAPHYDQLGVTDLVVISGRLWNQTFRGIPNTLGPVYLGSWGFMLMISAVTITSGLIC